MPYVTDDDSKAVRRITEIQRRLQEAKAELDRWLATGCMPTGAAELAQREREGKALTDRLQALAIALEVQRALASPALHEQERMLAKASPRKMKDFGYRPVTVQFLGGLGGLGRRSESDTELERLKRDFADTDAYNIACTYAYRGETGKAMDWLQRAYDTHDPGLSNIKVDPLLQSLHGNPRYLAMLRKLKLLDGGNPGAMSGT